MDRHIFYTPELKAFTKEDLPFVFTMNLSESFHALKVLRASQGEEVWLSNGNGFMCYGTIQNTDYKACDVNITGIEQEAPKKGYRLHIAVAPTKNISRFEWFLEKATEIGIDEITPLICDHSERSRLRYDRLEKVLVAAMKQSRRSTLPILNEQMDFNKFMQDKHSEQRYIALLGANMKITDKEVIGKGESYLILIGPEGDFSPGETAMAEKSGYKPISLTEGRLRTETAALAACMAINILNQ